MDCQKLEQREAAIILARAWNNLDDNYDLVWAADPILMVNCWSAAAGKDDAVMLTPPILLTLEQALEFIEDDELVEVTPNAIRLRKRFLKEHERKRSARG